MTTTTTALVERQPKDRSRGSQRTEESRKVVVSVATIGSSAAIVIVYHRSNK